MADTAAKPFRQSVMSRPRGGTFKCYRCRKVIPSKDGDWFPWNEMQVHLCRPCERETVKSPERRNG